MSHEVASYVCRKKQVLQSNFLERVRKLFTDKVICRFHVGKIRILLNFLWVNPFKKNINKNNIK